MRVVSRQTIKSLSEHVSGLSEDERSLRMIARSLSLPEKKSATISRIMGSGEGVSRDAENLVRSALGLEELPPDFIPVPPCSCGLAHTYDCSREEARKKRRPKPQPPAWVAQAANSLAELRQQRIETYTYNHRN